MQLEDINERFEWQDVEEAQLAVGWTPLFINAGGIVLEVGGLLQHGALVAREYGKPCIAGIENVTSLFTDGQTIEMDGLTGIIQILK